jgi:hypothetical protein
MDFVLLTLRVIFQLFNNSYIVAIPSCNCHYRANINSSLLYINGFDLKIVKYADNIVELTNFNYDESLERKQRNFVYFIACDEKLYIYDRRQSNFKFSSYSFCWFKSIGTEI